MKFLLRMAFWLGVVVLLLPTGHSKSGSDVAQPSAAEAVSAAGAAVADMREFCDRRPEACVVGQQAAVAFGLKAQAGAKMLYDFLTEKLGDTGSVAGAATDKADTTAAVSQNTASQNTSQDTLTPADLKPEWRAPAGHKEAAGRRPAA